MNLGSHPVLTVMAIAVAASLLAEVRIGIVRVPVIIWEIVFGILIGPRVLALAATTGGLLEWFEDAGLVALFFMAGMELDLQRVKGRPLSLALRGWILSLAAGFAAAALFYWLAVAQNPIAMALALSTTALGTFLPVLHDAGRSQSRFGIFVMAAGAAGEFGPVIAISLVLTPVYGAWLGVILMLAFAAVTVSAALAASGLRPLKMVNMLERTLHSSSQLPVCLSLLLITSMALLAEKFGFEQVLGAFAAGMVAGLATEGEPGRLYREKMEAICFGFLVPFFFVVSGMNLDVASLVQSPMAILLAPMCLALFLLVRGIPVLLYRKDLTRGERLPFALYSATALPLVVAISHVGVKSGFMLPEIGAALVAAGMLSVLIFPTLAEVLLSRSSRSASGGTD